MRFVLWAGLLGGLLTIAAGCRNSEEVDQLTVGGTVTLDGQPLKNATVAFKPQGDTKGHGGAGTTDASGRYEVRSPYGKIGLPVGVYKVVISRRLNPDGSEPDPNEKPFLSNAVETLPPRYSHPETTELSRTLTENDKGPIDFAIQSR